MFHPEKVVVRDFEILLTDRPDEAVLSVQESDLRDAFHLARLPKGYLPALLRRAARDPQIAMGEEVPDQALSWQALSPDLLLFSCDPGFRNWPACFLEFRGLGPSDLSVIRAVSVLFLAVLSEGNVRTLLELPDWSRVFPDREHSGEEWLFN